MDATTMNDEMSESNTETSDGKASRIQPGVSGMSYKFQRSRKTGQAPR